MVLDTDEALKIVRAYTKNLDSDIEKAREYNTLLNQLVNGIDFSDLLSQIEHIEKSDKKFQARKKYSRSIKDLNERLLRPIDNVFTASGGSKVYELKEGKQFSVAMTAINYCRGNKSLSKFISTIWKDAFIVDPQGLIYVEISEDGEKAYPTYKSIQDIQYYKLKGQDVEYVLFKPYKSVMTIGAEEKEVDTVRFVDDATERIYVRKDKSEYELVEERVNYFKKVPAVVISDNEFVGTRLRYSILDKVTEIQKEYMRDQSILTLVKFLNGFKTLVRPKIVCTTCSGLGKDGDEQCSDCGGTGFSLNSDITDEIILPIDTDNAEQNIPSASDIAKYIGLDVETWNQYRGELKVLEVLIYEALWGTHMTNQENNTATAKFIDTQPVINKLNSIADVAEYVEQEVADLIIKHALPTIDKSQKYATINYGRRFIIDPPDAILSEYKKARTEGVNHIILDKIYSEYLTSKYKSDEETLRIMILKSNCEPYLHYSAKEVKEILGENEAYKKIMFHEFWKSVKDPLKYKDASQVKTAFEQFLKENPKQGNEDGQEPTPPKQKPEPPVEE